MSLVDYTGRNAQDFRSLDSLVQGARGQKKVTEFCTVPMYHSVEPYRDITL